MSNRRTLATLYGIGLIRRAPGTAGSLAASLLAYVLLLLPHGWGLLAISMAVLTLLGLRSAHHYMRDHHTVHDPSEIVVDELSGQWLTYLIWYQMLVGAGAAQGIHATQIDVAVEPQFMLLGFALFRLFDILKPWPIRWADRNIKGAFGVMFDDILAAIPAGILLYFAYVYWPLLFGGLEYVP